MLIHLSETSAKPMYEQVIEQIQRLVMIGELKPGESLPSIRELTKELATSGITIRRAYQELEKDGFIYTRPGKGSLVAPINEEKKTTWKREQIRGPIHEIIQRARWLGISEQQIKEVVRETLDDIHKENKSQKGRAWNENRHS